MYPSRFDKTYDAEYFLTLIVHVATSHQRRARYFSRSSTLWFLSRATSFRTT